MGFNWKKAKGKGHKKTEQKYMSKKQALHKLQADNDTFRRLCILKGVYPQEIKKAKSNRTFFATKDINLMMADPLLYKFFEFQTWKKKLRKATDKGEKIKQSNFLKWEKPMFEYGHLVKERYPNFAMALKDLSDSLSLLFMFRLMPSNDEIPDEMLDTVKRLTNEFMTYVIRTHSLRKAFVTVKGIYYQVRIKNVPITWVTPFNFPFSVNQNKTEMPFFVFKEFLNFYTTSLGFINHKLYNDIGIQYPLHLKETSEKDMHSYLLDLDPDHVQVLHPNVMTDEEVVAQQQESEERLKNLNIKAPTAHDDGSRQELGDAHESTGLDQFEESTSNAESLLRERAKFLFKNMVFYISRECPGNALELIIRSFAGEIVSDPKAVNITHYIVDRPAFKADRTRNIDYVQPQWVFDCINSSLLLPTAEYQHGVKLPPHLSPFVIYSEGDYVPAYQEKINKLKQEAVASLRAFQSQLKNGQNNPMLAIQNLIDEEANEKLAEIRYNKELEAEKMGMSYAEFESQLSEHKARSEQNQMIHTGKLAKTKKKQLADDRKKLAETMLSQRRKREYTKAKEREERQQKKQLKLRRKRALMDKEEAEQAEKMQDEEPVVDESVIVHESEATEKTAVNNENDDDEFAGLDDLDHADEEEEEVPRRRTRSSKSAEDLEDKRPSKKKRQSK
mmetsp:Transcript_2561/g.3700  ORF Transcript_2561/g.3700 Transcript_2561/m.3700 type:complete len:674 (-) Transcript_2561:1597-3618(-)